MIFDYSKLEKDEVASMMFLISSSLDGFIVYNEHTLKNVIEKCLEQDIKQNPTPLLISDFCVGFLHYFRLSSDTIGDNPFFNNLDDVPDIFKDALD